MSGIVSRFRSASARTRYLLAAAGASVLAMGSPALAQFTPGEADPIEFPVTLASIAEVILTAGAAILVLVFGIWVGFKLVKKVMGRVTKAV